MVYSVFGQKRIKWMQNGRMVLCVIALGLSSFPAHADTLTSSKRPISRPNSDPQNDTQTAPKAKPEQSETYQATAGRVTDETPEELGRERSAQTISISTFVSQFAVLSSPRPPVRPKALAREFARTAPKLVKMGRRGRVCGVNEIKGQIMPAIPGKIRGCGLANPVKISEVSGIKLRPAAIMDCTTAQALNTWVRKGVFTVVGRMGGGASSLRIIGHYSCRTRNNKKGAKISEHGRGRAIDIAGIGLKDGLEISVLKGWRNSVQGPVLKKLHKAACGPFGTVLGPNSDRHHQDHFHFDTARYRSGSYCR